MPQSEKQTEIPNTYDGILIPAPASPEDFPDVSFSTQHQIYEAHQRSRLDYDSLRNEQIITLEQYAHWARWVQVPGEQYVEAWKEKNCSSNGKAIWCEEEVNILSEKIFSILTLRWQQSLTQP